MAESSRRRVDGQRRARAGCSVEPRKTLADFLREDCAPHRARTSAASTACAARARCCSTATRCASCLMFAVQADGAEVTTVEGLAPADGAAQRRAGRRSASATACSAGSARRASSCRSPRSSRDNPRPDRRRDPRRRCPATCAAAPATRASSTRSAWRPPRRSGAQRDRRRPTRPHRRATASSASASQRREDARLLTGHGTLRRRRRRAGHAARRLRAQRHRPRHASLDSTSTAARALPGVVAVFTARRPQRRASAPAGSTSRALGDGRRAVPLPGRRRRALRRRSVALVVAESRYIAEDACELIEVDIDPLDAGRRLRRRARPGRADSCTPSSATNVAGDDPRRPTTPSSTRSSRRRAHVVTETFDQHRYLCVPMETRGIVVDWDPYAQRARRVDLDAGPARRARLPRAGARRAREPGPRRSCATSAAASARRCSCSPRSWPSCWPASASAGR